MYISQLVKTRDPHPGLLIIAILLPFLLILTSQFLPWICFISCLLPHLYKLYLLSYLVEVLLHLLTYKGDLVYSDLVSKVITSYMLHLHLSLSKLDNA
jgi:hypothetical protein